MLKVVPVLDVLGGLAVQAFKGRREAYRPLKSVLCETAEPLSVAKAFASLGFKDLYLADLDAILKKNPDYTLYKRIATETGLLLLVDAGVDAFDEAEKILSSGASKVVVGTETLTNPELVRHLVEALGKEKVIVSIDLMGGRVLSKAEALRRMEPRSVAGMFQRMGVIQGIVLDLSRVGSEDGPDFHTLELVVVEKEFSTIAGGGVRGLGDLNTLRRMGVSAVLVATALHTGKISMEKLREGRFI